MSFDWTRVRFLGDWTRGEAEVFVRRVEDIANCAHTLVVNGWCTTCRQPWPPPSPEPERAS